MNRLIRMGAAAAVLVVALGVGVPAQAAPASHCRPPVAGFLIRDVAHKRGGVFYVPADNVTSGLFVGWGGTWIIVHCVRS